MQLKPWLRLVRLRFLLASVIAVSAGIAVSWNEGAVLNLYNASLTMLGVVLLHASVDVLNDYWDFKRGIDTKTKRTPSFSGILYQRFRMRFSPPNPESFSCQNFTILSGQHRNVRTVPLCWKIKQSILDTFYKHSCRFKFLHCLVKISSCCLAFVLAEYIVQVSHQKIPGFVLHALFLYDILVCGYRVLSHVELHRLPALL